VKKLLLSSTFLVIGSAASMAADLKLPVKARIAAAPVFSWTGCYVGLHAGGAKMHTSIATNFEGAGFAGDNSGTGAVAGGQAGCNYQQGNWVFGVEGEGSWSSTKATNLLTLSPINSESFTTKNTSEFQHRRPRRHRLRPHADLRQGRLGLG
jgi:outer membrane immunogenic protein